MRVVFAGTPPFAARALEALIAAGHDIPLVLTQPDRPAGRERGHRPGHHRADPEGGFETGWFYTEFPFKSCFLEEQAKAGAWTGEMTGHLFGGDWA